MNKIRENVRNIAIIAHVDHGKTTLVDRLLQEAGIISEHEANRAMDSNELEQERGITILAKNTGVEYNGKIINIVDTPGHSDFGGEVERTLQMVEGFLLLVDAAEGVLPGTRFVLQKALELDLRPIVLINKIDRPDADCDRVEEEIHDLFLTLAHHDDHLEFPVLYGSAKEGFVTKDYTQKTDNMKALFEAIEETIPAPKERNENLQLLVTNLGYSDFLGQLAVGRVFGGSIKVGQQIICCKKDGSSGKPQKITKVSVFKGLDTVDVEQAEHGDIVTVAGFTQPVAIGDTLCNVDSPCPITSVSIDEPTLSVQFSVNDSPYSGKDGKLLTSRQIKERLEKELKTNVSLRVTPTASPDVFTVSGRGQLHISILVETMRREGFELQISAPEFIYKTIDGVKHEPFEHVVIDVMQEHQGVAMELLGSKKAELKNMTHYDDRVRIEFEVPSRGLLGFRNQFLSETRGTGIATFMFCGYKPYKGDITIRTKGALVSMENGIATAFALNALQARGVLFIKPGQKIYEGMIIGENSRPGDLAVNPCKAKKLTNMRASGSDETVRLDPPRPMTLEACMEWIMPDELIEVTPQSIRLRKKILRAALRK